MRLQRYYSKGIIYLITCNKCGKQYIRKSKNPLKERINHHPSTDTKSIDSELARAQAFVLDLLRPLSYLLDKLECDKGLSEKELGKALSKAKGTPRLRSLKQGGRES